MEKYRSVSTMRIVGGHPGLDLANTVDCRHGHFGPDLLVTYGDLLEWAARIGMLDADTIGRLRRRATAAPDEADAALARAKQLREAVYRVFAAAAAGAEPAADDVDRIGDEARRGQMDRRLAWTGQSCAWVWPDQELDAPIGRLAHDAAELLASAQLRRVKECFGHNCGWLFLDTSRNGLRRWCSEEGCGTRSRVARHRAKTRGSKPEAV